MYATAGCIALGKGLQRCLECGDSQEQIFTVVWPRWDHCYALTQRYARGFKWIHEHSFSTALIPVVWWATSLVCNNHQEGLVFQFCDVKHFNTYFMKRFSQKLRSKTQKLFYDEHERRLYLRVFQSFLRAFTYTQKKNWSKTILWLASKPTRTRLLIE